MSDTFVHGRGYANRFVNNGRYRNRFVGTLRDLFMSKGTIKFVGK